MADWEGETDEIPIPIAFPAKKQWANEDVDEDQIKVSWEIDSSEDEDKTKPPKEETPKKKKTTITQKIAEKELKRKQAAEEKERRKQNYSEEDSDLDPLEKKKRDAKAVIEADLENAEGMFKGVTIRETEGSPLDRINPKTKEEFDEFCNLLVERIRKHEKQGLYINFINGFVRELCSSLKDVDIRKVSSTLATMANEKAKATKEANKAKKKKAKPSLQTDDVLDTVDYGNYDDDYDDFM